MPWTGLVLLASCVLLTFSVGLTVLLVSAVRAEMTSAMPEEPTSLAVGNPYELPVPGVDLDLYRRVTELLNTLEADKNAVIAQRDEALAQLEEKTVALSNAKNLLRDWLRPNNDAPVRPVPLRDRLSATI